jgi:tRNA (mo5U34)-methyltransferase
MRRGRGSSWYGRGVKTQVPSLESALDREWYHTLELAPGVVTPGWFDTRKVVSELPFPASLAGKRCLDVATFDGFWAFEMESRGAAEVVAIDLLDPAEADWPVNSTSAVKEAIGQRKEGGRGFDIAHELRGSSVERIEMSVYDLDPALVGEFDFVYVGSLLIHLRDPVRALERVRSVCRGTLLLVDNVNLGLTVVHPRQPVAALDGVGRPWWWKMNMPALVRAVEAGGFRLLKPAKRIWMPPGPGHPPARLSRHLLRSADARERLVGALKGDPHGVILAEPVYHA